MRLNSIIFAVIFSFYAFACGRTLAGQSAGSSRLRLTLILVVLFTVPPIGWLAGTYYWFYPQIRQRFTCVALAIGINLICLTIFSGWLGANATGNRPVILGTLFAIWSSGLLGGTLGNSRRKKL